MIRKYSIMAVVLAGALALAACTGGKTTDPKTTDTKVSAPAATKSRLDLVKERGKLICGTNNTLKGFGFMATDGKYNGFDTDFCRAVAAAVLGDVNKLEFRPLNAQQRFTAVQTGEVDVLFRNSTYTITRDSGVNKMDWTPVTFYDGQGMMVRKDSGIKSLKDFQGRQVCVQTSTTTELNLADTMRRLNVTYKSVPFQDAPSAVKAYAEKRCDGYTTDRSGLASELVGLATPADHMILEETMSKEPFAGAVVEGDSKWLDVVSWVVNGLIEAEEYGITSKNIDSLKDSKDPAIRKLIGLEGKFGEGLGLNNDWVAQMVKQVGNYGEIYEKNLGESTAFKLPRGLNNLYTKGGIMYAPPIR